MPKLTEVLLNRSRTVRFFNGDPKKIRILLPPALRNKVAVSSSTIRVNSCEEKLGRMTDCWKEHDFDEKKCLTELVAYQECIQKSQVEKKGHKKAQEGKANAKDSWMVPRKQVTSYLQRYYIKPDPIVIKTHNHRPVDLHRKKKHDKPV